MGVVGHLGLLAVGIDYFDEIAVGVVLVGDRAGTDAICNRSDIVFVIVLVVFIQTIIAFSQNLMEAWEGGVVLVG